MKLNLNTIILIVILVFTGIDAKSQQKHTISGYVKDSKSKELLIGVNIYIPGTQIGTTSNSFGFYSITLSENENLKLKYSFIGYEVQIKEINLNHDIELNILLKESSLNLESVEVSADMNSKISRDAEMSIIQVPIKQIQEIPALLGEKDVFKVLQYMPGVKSGSEASSGLYVRGGGPDQNLIILDDAVVYNAFHLFGFFSVFNGDALKSVELTKGGFPARYGGRLSSVIDMRMKDGNKQEFDGEIGVGIISSRGTIEGPLVKNKASFLVSARRTYIDILTQPIIKVASDGNTAGYFFHDFNAKMNYEISDKDKLYLSFYYGKDKFYMRYKDLDYSDEYNLFWTNQTATLRWNHQFNNKLFSNLAAVFSNYKFQIDIEENYDDDRFFLEYKSGIRDFALKYDFSFVPNPNHYIRFGAQSTLHHFTPSAFAIEVTDNDEFESRANIINTLESALYFEDEIRLFGIMKINAGLRFVNYYMDSLSRYSLEPRILAGIMLSEDFSFKASYAKMNQFIHLLSTTGVGLPTDLWVPATDKVGPQKSHQIAAGFAKDIAKPAFSISLEGYYKTMNDVIAYKEGASFLQIGDQTEVYEFEYESAVTTGEAYSYGVELLLQRKYGRLSGWIGYTLSWTKMRFDELNFGKEFFARYDRRHDISVVGIFKINDDITLSSTWVYGSGEAITLSTGQFGAFTHNYLNQNFSYGVNDYGEMNGFRMAPYHRLDIGVRFSKTKENGNIRTWEVSIYNVYNRQNPFFYFTQSEYNEQTQSSVLKLKQVSLFPIIPSISYSLKF